MKYIGRKPFLPLVLVLIMVVFIDATASKSTVKSINQKKVTKVTEYSSVELWNLKSEKDVETRRKKYFVRFRHVAEDMQQRYGIPPAITLAQGVLESHAGGSRLAIDSNNHFGIKARKGCKKCKKFLTKEVRNGKTKTEEHYFRQYDTAWDSFKDHALLIKSGKNFKRLKWCSSAQWKRMGEGERLLFLSKNIMLLGAKKQKIGGAVIEVENAAGYCTDPLYHDKLMGTIVRYRLWSYWSYFF